MVDDATNPTAGGEVKSSPRLKAIAETFMLSDATRWALEAHAAITKQSMPTTNTSTMVMCNTTTEAEQIATMMAELLNVALPKPRAGANGINYVFGAYSEPTHATVYGRYSDAQKQRIEDAERKAREATDAARAAALGGAE